MSPLGGGVFAERNARAQAASDEAAGAAGAVNLDSTDVRLRVEILSIVKETDAAKLAYDWVVGKD